MLGIETKDGAFLCLVKGNERVPTRRSRVFTTVSDNQARIEIHVLQGVSDIAAHNRSLAKFELTGIPPAAKGVPQIEVTFEVDVNGILSVNAKDRTTGHSQNIVVPPSVGLSQADVRRLLEEARAPEGEEPQYRELQATPRDDNESPLPTERSPRETGPAGSGGDSSGRAEPYVFPTLSTRPESWLRRLVRAFLGALAEALRHRSAR
jgi:molecular chaperone DnaK